MTIKDDDWRWICWLRVTDYMRGWLRKEFGCGRRAGGQVVLSVFHLQGFEEIMMMPVERELPAHGEPGNAISASWRNALTAGMAIDPSAMKSEYGVDREVMERYLPVACPANAIAENGLICKWNNDMCFGKQQTTELLRLLREAFWKAVGDYSVRYASEHVGEKYAQVDMIEEFCQENDTDDLYVEAIRREWQRRLKKKQKKC